MESFDYFLFLSDFDISGDMSIRFDEDVTADKFIVEDTMLRLAGINTKDIISKKISVEGRPDGQADYVFKIKGLTKDEAQAFRLFLGIPNNNNDEIFRVDSWEFLDADKRIVSKFKAEIHRLLIESPESLAPYITPINAIERISCRLRGLAYWAEQRGFNGLNDKLMKVNKLLNRSPDGSLSGKDILAHSDKIITAINEFTFCILMINRELNNSYLSEALNEINTHIGMLNIKVNYELSKKLSIRDRSNNENYFFQCSTDENNVSRSRLSLTSP